MHRQAPDRRTTLHPQAKATPAELTTRVRMRGCLLGGAVGDALGAPVEFLSLAEIRGRFGPEGIRDMAPAYGRVGAITDDTQMTLFTAEGLLRAWVRQSTKGICHPPSVIHHAYLRWLLTQGERPEGIDVGCESWLYSVGALHARRAPGLTCLSALRTARGFGEPAVAQNSSKGCGGVMRVAPIGLLASRLGGHDRVFGLAADVAALTHGHPTGQLSAGFLAVAVAALSSVEPGLIWISALIERGAPPEAPSASAVSRFWSFAVRPP
jgi:ADP-ribosylglycohydrolase